MSQKHAIQDATGVVETLPGVGIMQAVGTTVPTDGAAGFGPGCLFQKTNGSLGTQLYINEGTATSCDFNLVKGLASATEVDRACDVSTRVVDCTTATLTVTEADHDGKMIVLDRAAGIAVTLPAPVAGMHLTFIVKTTFTGAASIKSVSGAHIMVGHALMGNNTDNTVVLWQSVAASTNDTIDLFGTANSTGGIEGEKIELWGLSSTLWHVEITGDAAGTEATPFANTVA